MSGIGKKQWIFIIASALFVFIVASMVVLNFAAIASAYTGQATVGFHPPVSVAPVKTPTPTPAYHAPVATALGHLPVPALLGTPTAYVSDAHNNRVIVIDMNEDKVIGNIGVGRYPQGIAASPDGTRVYVVCKTDKTVTVIDTASNAAIANITVGNYANGVAVSLDGKKAYVANSADNTLSIIDTTTNSVANTIGVGGSPCGVIVNPGNGDIYVANGADHNIMIVHHDAVSGTISPASTIQWGPEYGLACTPDGSRLYVGALTSDINAGAVIDYNLATHVTKTMAVKAAPRFFAISSDGSKAYVSSSDSNNVAIIDTAGDHVAGNISLNMPQSVAFKPDGKAVYVCQREYGNIAVIDPDLNLVKTTIDCSGEPFMIAVAMVRPVNPSPSPSVSASPLPVPSDEPLPTGQAPSQSSSEVSSSGTTTSPDVTSGILPTPTAATNLTSGNASEVSATPRSGGFEILLAVSGILGALYILRKKD